MEYILRNSTKRIKYQDYIKGEKWKEFRIHIVQRDMGLCQHCGAKGMFVHHLTYRNFRHENMDDCLLLCRKCHGRQHWLPNRKRTFHPSGAVTVEKLK